MQNYNRHIPLAGKKAQEIYFEICKDIDQLFAKIPVGKFKVTRDDEKREIYLKSMLVNAKLICQEEYVQVEAQLSILAAPFRSKIDEGINRWIEKALKL